MLNLLQCYRSTVTIPAIHFVTWRYTVH